MQKWEYTTFVRSRDFTAGSAKQWNEDITKRLAELGEQGWELVNVVARCDKAFALIGSGDQFGATTADLWVFKRLKS